MHNLLYSSNKQMKIQGMSLVILIIVLIISLVFEIAIIVASVKLAEKKGRSGAAWGWATFFFGIVSLIILACLSNICSPTNITRKYSWTCWHCKCINFGQTQKCSNCGADRMPTPTKTKSPVPSSEKPTATRPSSQTAQPWFCPKCGESNNGNAKNCINCFEKKPE